MKVGDVIQLPIGAKRWWGIKSKTAVVVDRVEFPPTYQWIVFADGRTIKLNHQLESLVRVLDES